MGDKKGGRMFLPPRFYRQLSLIFREEMIKVSVDPPMPMGECPKEAVTTDDCCCGVSKSESLGRNEIEKVIAERHAEKQNKRTEYFIHLFFSFFDEFSTGKWYKFHSPYPRQE